MDRAGIVRAARQPASAAIAGLIFGVTLAAVIFILQGLVPEPDEDFVAVVLADEFQDAVGMALAAIPFAGIAFLWFMAVIRVRLGSREDRFFETVFLGSGLLFVAMLFAAGGVLGGAVTYLGTGADVSVETLALAWSTSQWLLGSFGARMGAVFILSVTTMGVRSGTVPKWLAAFGYLTAILLLLTPPVPSLSQYLFPLWVIIVSVVILIRGHEVHRDDARPTN